MTSPDAAATTSYASKLFHHLTARPEETAFLLGDEALTWRELDRRSRQYAAGLRAMGVEKGDRVACLLETSLELVVALLGHYRLGVVHVPINTQYREREVGHILRDSGARAIVIDAGIASYEVLQALDTPATLEHQIVIGGASSAETRFEDVLQRAPADNFEPAAVEDDDLALFIYTSGTTGQSKGVEHTYRSVVSNIDALTNLWQWTPDDRQVLALPLFHVHGLGIGIHGTLIRGCTTVLLPSFDARRVADEIGAGGTIFMGVPTMHMRLLRAMNEDETGALADKLSRARLFTSGSAALPLNVLQGIEEHTGRRILERYGMSETMLTISNPYDEERRPGTVGFPVSGCEIRIVNDDFEECGVNEIGEIIVRGDSVMRGYWNQPERTDEAFRPGGWFLTGDVARRDEDGYISIVGRRSVDIINSGGYKISAREIEEVLRVHPYVGEIAIVGVPDPEWGETISAAVVPSSELPAARREEPETLLDELTEQLTNELASYKKPRRLKLMSELPRNALGKVQKHRIMEAFEDA